MDITHIISIAAMILAAVLTAVIIPAVKRHVIPWLAAATGKEQTAAGEIAYAAIQSIVKTAVLAAEEAARKGLIDKKDKFIYAENYLKKKGVVLDSDELVAVIDAAVHEIFNAVKTETAVAEETFTQKIEIDMESVAESIGETICAAIDATKPPSAPKTKYRLHLAAFDNTREGAEGEINQYMIPLKSAAYPVYSEIRGDITDVYVGDYSLQKSAKSAQSKLDESGRTSTLQKMWGSV